MTESKISFSLDLYEKDMHNKLRRQSSFDSIINYIKFARKDGTDVRVITTWQKNVDLKKFSDFI